MLLTRTDFEYNKKSRLKHVQPGYSNSDLSLSKTRTFSSFLILPSKLASLCQTIVQNHLAPAQYHLHWMGYWDPCAAKFLQ